MFEVGSINLDCTPEDPFGIMGGGGPADKKIENNPSSASSGYNSDNASGPVYSPDYCPKAETVTELMPDFDQKLKCEATHSEEQLKIEPCDCPQIKNDTTRINGSSVLKNIIQARERPDTKIVCSDGHFGVHRVVMVAASPFLGHLLRGQRLGEVATIIVPDIPVRVMEVLVNLCYTGEMTFPTELEDEVYGAMQELMIGQLGEFTLRKVTVAAPLPPVPKDPVVAVSDVFSSVPGSDLQSASQCLASTSTSSGSAPQSPSELNSDSGSSDSEDDSIVPLKKPLPPPASVIVIQNGTKFECSLCNAVLASKHGVSRHLLGHHRRVLKTSMVSAAELKELQSCKWCSNEFDTITRANECLNSHGYFRCYTCLDIFPTKDQIRHYRTAHGVRTKHGLAAKCRWCDMAYLISNNAIGPKRHAIQTHFNSVPKGPSSVISSTKDQKSKNSEQTVHPFFKAFQKNMKEVSEVTATSKHSYPTKKRKLDETGRPLQLARRTGVPVGRPNPLKCVLSSMKYNAGVYSLVTDATTGTVKDLKVLDLPAVHVHLNWMSQDEINKHRFPPAPVTLPEDIDMSSMVTNDTGTDHIQEN